MKRIGLILLLLMSHTVLAEALYPFDNPKKTAQFQGLLKELRCLVCQNQDLNDSHAPLAIDLKNEVYRLVQEGKSDDEIIRYLTARYGDFILFKPPVKSATYILWFAPFVFLLLGFALLMMRVRRE